MKSDVVCKDNQASILLKNPQVLRDKPVIRITRIFWHKKEEEKEKQRKRAPPPPKKGKKKEGKQILGCLPIKPVGRNGIGMLVVFRGWG